MTDDRADDSKAFRDFELAGWEINVSEYENGYTPVTRQATEPLLDAAKVQSGTKLLDVATGPGLVAAAAVARGAWVIAVDFSTPMVSRARVLYPELDFREGDAEALEFPDGSFDAVVMNFGMLHLARPEQASSEAARVLRPGGRFAFTVWSKPAEARGFGIALEAIQCCGNANVPLPPGPPFFRFSDSDESTRLLHSSGFGQIAVRSLPLTWRIRDPDEVFRTIYTGGVRVKAVLRAQTSEALQRIRDSVREAAMKYARNGIIEVPMTATLVSGVRPAQ